MTAYFFTIFYTFTIQILFDQICLKNEWFIYINFPYLHNESQTKLREIEENLETSIASPPVKAIL